MIRFVSYSFFCAILVSIAACGASRHASKTTTSEKPSKHPSEIVYIEGHFTNEGVECVAFRSVEGELFTLLGIPEQYRSWENFLHLGFSVVGEEVAVSFCMQGRTLRVLKMTAILSDVQ